MKNLLFVILTFLASFALASHPHHSSHHSHSNHHSSSHSSYHISHGTSHHTSSHNTSHPYNHVSKLNHSDVHSYRLNNVLMYYYLLHNKNTNTHDTIKAKSIEELNTAVDEVSNGESPIGLIIIIGVVAFIVFLAIVYFKG